MQWSSHNKLLLLLAVMLPDLSLPFLLRDDC